MRQAVQECRTRREFGTGTTHLLHLPGTLLARLDRHAEAIEQFRKAIEVEPDHWDVHVALAMELSRANRLAEATSEFGQVIRRWPDLVQARLAFGQILVQQGLRDQAAQQFQEVLRRDPGNQTARQNLAALQNELVK